ncbi:peptidase C1-like family-domain-containing protein [Podospora australis]|uniref:Bleomycin hydrolase n=1 Tax=Podospora australis TaxID=1536484 RepID=A0AAN6X466_9PEZI|nr:peptidase C1-like family-domain-containing protein [Podospora australis]
MGRGPTTIVNLDFEARVPVPFSIFPSSYRESETATQTQHVHEELKIEVPHAGLVGQHSSFPAPAPAPLPPREEVPARFEEEVRITRDEERHHRPGTHKEFHFHKEVVNRPQPPPPSYPESRIELDDRRSNIDVAESEYRARVQPSYRKEVTVDVHSHHHHHHTKAPKQIAYYNETTVDVPAPRPSKAHSRVADDFTVDVVAPRPAYKETSFRVSKSTVDDSPLPRATVHKDIKIYKETVDAPRYVPSSVSSASSSSSKAHQSKMGYYDEDGTHHSFRQEIHKGLHKGLHKLADRLHHHEAHGSVEVAEVRSSAGPTSGSKASNTVTIPCHHIRLGDILILQGRPCQVIRISTSAATGQHRYLGVDLFTKQLHEESSFVSNPAPSVVVQTMLGPVFKQYRVLDMQDGAIVAMTETGDVKQNLPVIDQSSLWTRLQKAFESGRGSVRVLVVTDHGREMAVDMKRVTLAMGVSHSRYGEDWDNEKDWAPYAIPIRGAKTKDTASDTNSDDSGIGAYIHVDNEAVKDGKKVQNLVESHKPETISVSLMRSWQDTLLKDPKNRLALSALNNADAREVLLSRATKIAEQHPVFNVKIPFEGGPITAQGNSGRCWLFASTNVFRVALMQKYNLDAFELSQSYLFFWDKLEKSNWFLEQIISTADQDLDSRLVQHLLREPLSDGGQWDMVYNIVDKYGLVPQVLHPDSFNANTSRVLNSIIFTKLRENALTLRNLINDPSTTTTMLSSAKGRMLKEMHAILTISLGPPPSVSEEFTWTFTDKADKVQTVRLTPKAFAEDIYSAKFRITSSTISKMISLVHDPRHKPFSHLTVDRLGNVVGGRDITYVNVDMVTLKDACVAMLKAGLPIFFGSDVGKFSNSALGVMDLDLIDYELGFNISLLGADKVARLMTGESQMTHAMVLTAVHIDEESGKTVRWRVQNSWGKNAGEEGWFVMSDAWMDEFVYQAVVDPKFVSKEVKDVLDKEKIVLPLWDPMGSLA